MRYLPYVLVTLFSVLLTANAAEKKPNIAPTLHSDWVSGDREVLVKVLLRGLQGEIEINGELQHFEAPMPGFGPALGNDEIASILSYIRSAWTDAPADVTSAFVRKIRATEKEKTGPYEANALWKKKL